MNIGLMGHHVCRRTFSNLKSKHAKDSRDLNLTQLVILLCYYLSGFKNLHFAIFVSIQRQLGAWKRNAFSFLTRKFKVLGQVVMESAVVVERVQVVPFLLRK